MAVAQNKGARKAPATRKPRAAKPLQEETMSNTTEGTLTVETEKPKIVAPKKDSYIEYYRVPPGHNGILNHNAINLGSGALLERFTLDDLVALDADIGWLLRTGQIIKDGIEIINNDQGQCRR